uniref:G_PROTEIN_RECEP_F1_2 domain-containing protein n=1 Tax=Strongyloides venezuelensis TaxID=75913 RepID=A0A0K0F0R4_STRVS
MNLLAIVQLSYELPSYILYIIFTIQLGYKLIRKEKTFSNSFYILIFYKGLTDIILHTLLFLLVKMPRMLVFRDFFQMNSYLCSIFYLISTPCYTITFEIMLIMSINRYIAVGQPIMYERLFQNYLIYIYIFITLVIGGLIGVISSKFDCSYVYSDFLERLYVSYTTDDITSFVLAYTFGFYIPLVVISFILNVITIKKLKVKNFISCMSVSPDMRLLVYTFFSFVMAIFFLSVYILRVISIFTHDNFYNIIGSTSLPYIIDVETYGSFYFSLFTNPQLLNMFCFRKMVEVTQRNFAKLTKTIYLDGTKKLST